ncbi:hypothetical protein [Epibacterium ulvae]|nr:hypothetical protein [Epibacterium ulvae]
MTKTTYAKPILRQHGKIEAVTKGGTNGGQTDAFFPAGTLFSDITFS